MAERIRFKTQRLLQEQSRSYIVSVPKPWVEALGLEQGSRLLIVYGDGESLHITPIRSDK